MIVVLAVLAGVLRRVSWCVRVIFWVFSGLEFEWFDRIEKRMCSGRKAWGYSVEIDGVGRILGYSQSVCITLDYWWSSPDQANSGEHVDPVLPFRGSGLCKSVSRCRSSGKLAFG